MASPVVSVAVPKRTIVIASFPSGAVISVEQAGGSVKLGLTGKPLELPVIPILDQSGQPIVGPDGQAQLDRLRLKLELPQHKVRRIELSSQEQLESRYPRDGVVNLTADSTLVQVQDSLKEHPLGFALAGLVACSIGVWLWRRRAHPVVEKRPLVSDPWLDQVVSGYRLVQLVGEGGMGAVYRGEAVRAGAETPVAVKILTDSGDSKSRRRFLRECKVSAALSHPNIVRILQFGEHEGHLYLVMELLEGCELADHWALPLPLGTLWGLLRPVFEALDYAHQQGVVHRDIKPSNIFVCRDGTVKILDFGIARRQDLSRVTTLTVFGTPHFLAPETMVPEVNEALPSPCLDQYALGVILYLGLTGGYPFDAEDVEEIISQQMESSVPAMGTGVASSVQAVVHKMLEKLPVRRYRSLSEIVERIDALVADSADSGERQIPTVAASPSNDPPTAVVARLQQGS